MLDYRREDPPRTRRIVPLGYVVFGVAVFLLISTIIFSHLANLKIEKCPHSPRRPQPLRT